MSSSMQSAAKEMRYFAPASPETAQTGRRNNPPATLGSIPIVDKIAGGLPGISVLRLHASYLVPCACLPHNSLSSTFLGTAYLSKVFATKTLVAAWAKENGSGMLSRYPGTFCAIADAGDKRM